MTQGDRFQDIANRLWQVATLLRSGGLTQVDLTHLGEICDDAAIVIADFGGAEYDGEKAERTDIGVSYKHSPLTFANRRGAVGS